MWRKSALQINYIPGNQPNQLVKENKSAMTVTFIAYLKAPPKKASLFGISLQLSFLIVVKQRHMYHFKKLFVWISVRQDQLTAQHVTLGILPMRPAHLDAMNVHREHSRMRQDNQTVFSVPRGSTRILMDRPAVRTAQKGHPRTIRDSPAVRIVARGHSRTWPVSPPVWSVHPGTARVAMAAQPVTCVLKTLTAG